MTENNKFRRALLAWYRQHGRHELPWRQTRDPYAILVSEVMLQQTQVATVRSYYIEWLRRFPSFAALAAAPESAVLHAWQGLGYYNRARNLHAAAKIIVSEHDGVFPIERAENLPGIGRYSANAIATFAFNAPVPIVEANTTRVLARLHNVRLPVDSSAGQGALWLQAADLVPNRNAGAYNSALIDLGALICTPREPKCGACPVRGFCRAPRPSELPVRRRNPAVKIVTEHHGFASRRGQVLLEQSSGRWRGMWILPRIAPRRTKPLQTITFPFTNHRITLAAFDHPSRRSRDHRWFRISSLEQIPMPSPHRRMLEALLARRESRVQRVHKAR
ncbi:MAG: A/G-specific adenine glycosylase [Chthoniobacterales bacterium]